jgi:transcriptional regulator with XRE-family HTH domain
MIRARRIELGMSQADLAGQLGISFQQVRKYEKGVNRVNANRLVDISKGLRMKVDDFYGGDAQALDVSSIIDVTDKATLRMLRAYGRIKDKGTQRQLALMMEALAAADEP